MRTDDDMLLATAEISRRLKALRAEFEEVKRELKYSPDQPRVPAGSGRESGRWTDGADGDSRGDSGSERVFRNVQGRTFRARPQPAPPRDGTGPRPSPPSLSPERQQPPRTTTPEADAPTREDRDARPDGLITARGATVEERLAEAERFRETLKPGERMIYVARAQEFGSQGSRDLVAFGAVSEERVRALCPRYHVVQNVVDSFDRQVRTDDIDRSPQQHGTEVHTQINHFFRSRPDLGIDSELRIRADPDRPEDSTVVVDGVERTAIDPRACAYDAKTGLRGMSALRFSEIADHVARLYGIGSTFIVVEVRPRWLVPR